jgi:beta-N-acetylhexosaminidase
MPPIGAFISGCAGLELTADEKSLFRDAHPWGLILFKRNVDSPDQVQSLTASFRDAVGRRNAPVLIDQEGGRVQRLGPPNWRKYPAARRYGELFEKSPLDALRATRLTARLIAEDLLRLGINVDCIPVLDVPGEGAHEVIGNRAYATSAGTVSILARAAMEGLMSGGVLPVIKHAPGHGRASVDSHHALPVVAASKQELEASDFTTFAAFADAPMAMTAHVVYSAYDPDNPATLSPKIIRLIRKKLGFDGLLMTDDLSMKALAGTMEDRIAKASAAGCDIMLHCNGEFAEMQVVAKAAGELKGRALTRARAALKRLRKPVKFDRKTALKEAEQLLLVEAGTSS